MPADWASETIERTTHFDKMLVFAHNILSEKTSTFLILLGVGVVYVAPRALFVGVLNREVSVFFVIWKTKIIQVSEIKL